MTTLKLKKETISARLAQIRKTRGYPLFVMIGEKKQGGWYEI